jgi:hypothetical protein
MTSRRSTAYNTLGMLVREKLVEPEVLYKINNVTPCFMWSKFKDVITENRRRYGGKDIFSDFELLNDEILRVKLSRDPSIRFLKRSQSMYQVNEIATSL